MVKSFSKSNIGGLVFSKPGKGDFWSLAKWVAAGCPDNCCIYDQPLTLQLAGIPLVDAQYVDGMYYKASNPTPETTVVTLPRAVSKNIKASSVTLKSYNNYIFYNSDLSKHSGKSIGTTTMKWEE